MENSNSTEEIIGYTQNINEVRNIGPQICTTFSVIASCVSFIAAVLLIIAIVRYNRKIRKAKTEEEKAHNEKKKRNCNIALIVMVIIFSLSAFISSIYDFAHKPIIYLYPEETTELSVTLGKPENITCSYPQYDDGWQVIAHPNGDLEDVNTGRKLYALYWEGITSKKAKLEEGFVVKKEDTIKFLEEKLEILGLNEHEAEEFIVYWLPQLQKNKYNLIRFAPKEEIDENMPLQFSKQPDTVIRVLMQYKGLNKYRDIPEQKLETPERKGFVAVEWGGTEVK